VTTVWRNVVVAGGAGGVGEGIVRALLADDPSLRVIVTSRDAARLDALRARLAPDDAARMVAIAGNAGDDDGAARIAARIEAEFGGVHVAIPSLGGWWEGGPLLEVDAATWDAVMHEMLRTHYSFARVFVPALLRRPGGVYLAIGGGAAFFPVPNASLVSIAAAAQIMLTKTLAAELRGRDVRIAELVVNGPIHTRDSATIAAPDWITADEVGRVVAELVRAGTSSWPRLRIDGPIVVMNPARTRD
jgi:NAD(P)-dependent dehydrogenase (short-subunit alcohol dehydrogenase family)